jgi:predicted RNA-binding protein YlxR (DUF448 family)
MHMLYNSDSYVVVRFDVPSDEGEAVVADKKPQGTGRGGYEIVDKFARKEIFIQGALAKTFQEGVEALIENDPSEEEVDAFIARYAVLMQQPVVMH